VAKAHLADLGEQVLALATGKTQQEITAACKGLARTISASSFPATSGLAASNSATGSYYATQSTGTEQAARSDTG